MSNNKIVITTINDNELQEIDSEMSVNEKEKLLEKVQNRIKESYINSEASKSRIVNTEHLVPNTQRKHTWRYIAAACLTLALLIPATVLAASSIKAYIISLKQDKLHIVYDIDKDNDAQSKKNIINVKLIYDFSKSYKTDIEGGYYSFIYKDGFDAGKNFLVEILQIDTSTSDEFFTEDVKESSSIYIKGRKAMYMELYDTADSQYTQNTYYSQRIIIFFSDYGYALQIYGMEGLGKEEFINLANDIDIAECSEDEATAFTTLSDYMAKRKNSAGNETWNGMIQEGKNAIYEVGQEFEYEGINYQVQSADIRDTISGLDMNYIDDSCGLISLLPKYTDESGKLLSYDRKLLHFGDGYAAPEKSVVRTEKVTQKFVYVTMKVKNNTNRDRDIMVCKRMVYIQEKQGEYYYCQSEYERGEVAYFQLDQYPKYFEETPGGKGYYFRTLKAGETMIFHIGYFVDEDKLGEMMLQYDNGGQDGGMKYVDIRQDTIDK